MKRLYPVLLKCVDNVVAVRIPDMEIFTEGKNMYDAIEMARDAIGLKGICLEDDNLEIPEASTLDKIQKEVDELITLVDIDFSKYRRQNDKRKIRKNVTISSWVNKEAEAQGINFSSVLEEALKSMIEIETEE